MSLKASDILGTSQVGVHLAMVGRVLFAPMQLTKKDVASLEDTLGLEVAQMSIGGSALVGALIAGNSNGIAVADIATEEDICLLYTSPSPRDGLLSRMPSSA